jgi:antitoxin component of RelBE/YafQ-DinJ toxin-antitoxin module
MTLLCMTRRDTLHPMAQAVSVRLDDLALRALSQLEATGLTRSAAIRIALVEAASRLADKRALAAEVASLENDDVDRAEMAMVADLMESLRAPR